MIARAKDGQSLVDIALMVTGSAEGVWALALRNGMSVTGKLGHGAAIVYESEDIEDARTASRYEAEGICPATEVSEALLAELLNTPKEDKPLSWSVIDADPVEPSRLGERVFSEIFEYSFV